ncbi:MAG: apiosidase-like domain-containing protein [Saccharofermentanales bacterium]
MAIFKNKLFIGVFLILIVLSLSIVLLFVMDIPVFKNSTDYEADSIQQWRVYEITLTAKDTAVKTADKFSDVEVTGEFVNKRTGRKLELFGFWDGSNTWKLRFAPVLPGDWTYIIKNNISDTGLQKTGTLHCVHYDGKLEMYNHGFIKISDNGRYFTYDDGTPFFWMGEDHAVPLNETWDSNNYRKYTGVDWKYPREAPNTSMFKGIADKRMEQGFTDYQFYMTNNTSAPYTETDIYAFREEYDKRIQYVTEEKGFQVELVFGGFYTWKDTYKRNWGLFKSDMSKKMKYFVARYGAYPVVWLIAGEPLGYLGYGGIIEADFKLATDAWGYIAQQTRAADIKGYERPISFYEEAHQTDANVIPIPISEENPAPWPSYFRDKEWLTYEGPQTTHYEGYLPHAGATLRYWLNYNQFGDKTKIRPVIEESCPFDDIKIGTSVITRELIRRTAYHAIQSGTAGVVYGANGIYDPTYSPDYVAPSESWGGHTNWYDAIDFESATDMTRLKNFYTSISWWTLEPRPEIVTSGPYARIVDWSFVLDDLAMPVVKADKELDLVTIYYPIASSAISGTITLKPSTKYEVKWYKADNGKWIEAADVVTGADGKAHLREKPDESNDYMLLLTERGKS